MAYVVDGGEGKKATLRVIELVFKKWELVLIQFVSCSSLGFRAVALHKSHAVYKVGVSSGWLERARGISSPYVALS